MNGSFGSFENLAKNTEVKQPQFFFEEFKEKTEITEGCKGDLLLFPFPEELEHEGGLRRMGVETGPSCFIKHLRQAPYSALGKGFKGVSLFDHFGFDSIHQDKPKFRQNMLKTIKDKNNFDLLVGIGGGSDILELYVDALSPEISTSPTDRVVIKLSPKLSFGKINDKKTNDNWLTHFCQKHPTVPINHFGLVPYITPKTEYTQAKSQGHQLCFLEPNFDYKQAFTNIQTKNSEKKVILLIDCEVFSSTFFHGVSESNIDGMDFSQVNHLIQAISTLNLDALLISNFNPTIESRRSSNFLVTFLYKMLKLKKQE